MSESGGIVDLEPKTLTVALSTAEAADMIVRAWQAGTPIEDYLGYYVRLGAYGFVHAEQVARDLRAKLGQVGTRGDAPKGGK